MSISKYIVTLFITLSFIIKADAQLSDSLYKALPDTLKPKKQQAVTDKEAMKMILNVNRELVFKYVNEFKMMNERLKSEIDKLDDKAEKVLYAQAIAGYCSQTSDWEGNEYWYRKVIEYGENETAHRNVLTNAYLNMALVFSYKQKIDSAVDLLQKASAIAIADKDSVTLSDIYYVNVSIYTGLQLEHTSLEYCDKYLATFKEKDKWSPPYTEIMMAKSFNFTRIYSHNKEQKYADSAEKIIREVMNATQADPDYWYQNCYKILGLLHYYKDDFKKAVVYYDSMFLPKYTKEGSHEGGLVYISKLNRALSFLQLGNDAALKDVLSIQIPDKDFASKQEINRVLSKYYAGKGDYKKSLDHYTLYKINFDSSNIIAQRGIVFEAQQKYSVAQKEVAISELEKKNLQQKNASNTILFAAIVVFLLMSLIVTLLYLRNRRQQVQRMVERQKLTDELSKMEKEIELERLTRQQEKENVVTTERQEISRNMHDEISSGLAALRYMIADTRKNAETDEAKNMLSEIEEEANTVYMQSRDFLHRLHQSSKNHSTNVMDLLTGLSLRFNADSSLQVITDVEEDKIESLFTPKQHEEIYRVIKEAVANCMKHSEANKISIQIYEKNDNFYFDIQDNGNKIVATEKQGIGLAAMEQRIYSLKGNIVIDSSGKGLKINGHFPVIRNAS